MSNDHINNPSHYTKGKIEVIDFIEDQDLNFHLGNAIKYICRCRFKGSHIDDLKKAVWYLNREISKLEIEKYEPITYEQLELPLEFKDTSKVDAPKQFDHNLSSCAFNGCYRCQTAKEMFDAPKIS